MDCRARLVGRRHRLWLSGFAHTSPVYVQQETKTWLKPDVAAYWVKEIDRSILYIRKNYRFASEADEAVARGLFLEAQTRYRGLSKEGS